MAVTELSIYEKQNGISEYKLFPIQQQIIQHAYLLKIWYIIRNNSVYFQNMVRKKLLSTMTGISNKILNHIQII